MTVCIFHNVVTFLLFGIIWPSFLYFFFNEILFISGYPHNPYNGVICNDTITATGVFASSELWALSKGRCMYHVHGGERFSFLLLLSHCKFASHWFCLLGYTCYGGLIRFYRKQTKWNLLLKESCYDLKGRKGICNNMFVSYIL